MKTVSGTHIYDTWAAGADAVGDDTAPNGIVTVEKGWVLRRSTTATPGPEGHEYDRGPIRWFQRTDNSQLEQPLSNLRTIEIDRSIDDDAAECTIVLSNTKMLQNGVIQTGTAGESLGQPGFYWPGRADSAESRSRWGHETNANWNDILVPNALLRTYQGYGGRSKTLDQALTDGNLVQTGTWLVDEITQDAASGDFTIKCRDMAKLLIEQTLYPPLVPTHGAAHYPLFYYRWVYQNHPVVPYGTTVYRTGFIPIENDGAMNFDSSSHETGHAADQAADGNDPDTFWVSAGHTVQDAFEYIQFNFTSTTVEGINIQPFAGNYVMYISVWTGGPGGGWEDGKGNIPVAGAMGINYVQKFGVGWERPSTFDLGATYPAATRIRLTFTHLAPTSVGGAKSNRAGVRDFNHGTFAGSTSGGGRTVVGIVRGTDDSETGYWVAGSDGGVYSFGGVKLFGSEARYPTNAPISGIQSSSDGTGYRLCAEDGGVFCFGGARYKGSLPGIGVTLDDGVKIVDIAGSGNNDGYWLIANDGSVYAFGNATVPGSPNHTINGFPGALSGLTAVVAIAARPGGGYWTLDSSGDVMAHGAATHLGDTGTLSGDFAVSMEAGASGDGYWIVTALGAVYAKGTATYRGGVNPGSETPLSLGANTVVDIARTDDSGGYWLVAKDGGVFVPDTGSTTNNAVFSGSLPEQWSAVREGNYQDYIDIVKDILLWSGWWFHNPDLGELTPPNVFGNLESTGVFAPDNLTFDFFDQKPCIDLITTFKEIVGYIAFADELGAYNFRHPNIFSLGNFLDTGEPTSLIPVIDEKTQLFDYQVSINDQDARSQIIIATSDPQANFSDTKSVTLTSAWGGDMLRGIVRPALWVNGKFLTEEIQNTMAQLIDLHLFLAQRQGSVTMLANPLLQIDDQVRIFERTTSETYIHYVRGYRSLMDFESGEYTMDLQTHWLGDGSSALTGDGWSLTY